MTPVVKTPRPDGNFYLTLLFIFRRSEAGSLNTNFTCSTYAVGVLFNQTKG